MLHSADGNVLAAQCVDHGAGNFVTYRLFDVSTGESIGAIPSGFSSGGVQMDLRPDGSLFAALTKIGVSPQDTPWRADVFFHGGSAGGQTRPDVWEGPRAPVLEIDGTDDDLVFSSERWFGDAAQTPAQYEIPVAPGRYRVTLLFAELFFTRDGKRSFDIRIEDKSELENYDIARNVGVRAADSRSFEVLVEDDVLGIELVKRIDFPKIAGIEVERLE